MNLIKYRIGTKVETFTQIDFLCYIKRKVNKNINYCGILKLIDKLN